MRKPILMMSNTAGNWEITGDACRADSWHNSTDGIHTVAVYYNNFVGGFKLQGTLAMKPTEDDWFTIHLQYKGVSDDGVLLYPKDASAPTGTNGGDSGVDAFTFVGNFTHLRALLVRSHIGEKPARDDLIYQVGSIDRVLLSL